MTAADLLDASYVTFGNKRRGVLLPLSSRAGARAGVGMLGASRRSTFVAEAAAMAAISIFGPRVVRGEHRRLAEVVDREPFAELWEDVEQCIGRADTVAVLRRAQSDRPGFAVLALRGDRVVAFVRMQPDRKLRVLEHDILGAVSRFRPVAFAVPEPLGGGVTRDWEWLALAPIYRLHRPDWKVAAGPLSDEISAALAGPLGPATTAGWAPMHGDLAPWNLRRQRSRPVVIDWETAGFGPSRADAAYLIATRAVARGRDPEAPIAPDAAMFWVGQLEARAEGSGLDASLRSRLIACFTSVGRA